MDNKLRVIAMDLASEKQTENGGFAYNTTNSALLDLFATGGSLRTREIWEIESKFAKAFQEDSLLAMKMLFYIGDIKNGLGERRTFRIGLKWAAIKYPNIVKLNLSLIPYYNRWDSIFELVGTPCEKAMWELFKKQWNEDVKNANKGENISLLGKWSPSENASSAKSKNLARLAAKQLNLSNRQYRKTLSFLRQSLNIVERKMSAQNWTNIKYEAVPSKAMMNYRNAFMKHNAEGFKNYLKEVLTGEKHINSKVLFPYEIISTYSRKGLENYDLVLEEQWKSLPNYITNDTNILIMADVSGSMIGRPMHTSIGLATYFAERNAGPLKGVYMTFSKEPHFVYLDKEMPLCEKIEKVENTDIGYNTNLEKAFDYLLQFAVRENFKQKDLPAALIVISDMEIDNYVRRRGLDFVKVQKRKYGTEGFEMPKLILWNVESRQDTFLTKDNDVIMISGQSPSTFKHLIGNLNGKTNIEMMLEVLNNKRYDIVII